jgi:hypothetical protein
MEFLLKWLDDLDDLLLAAAARRDRLRRWCLAAGLIAAPGLAIAGLQQTLAGAAVVLAAAAGVYVVVGLVAASWSVCSRVSAR